MQVRVLGDLEVLVDDVALELGGPKPRALLALLVVGDGRPVSLEHLIDQIWGDEPPVRVEASLQSYVARLRRVLEPTRDSRTTARVLRTHAGGYSLDLAPDAVDARRFASLLARARGERDAATAEHLLVDALALWRGAAFAGLPGPALAAEAVRLDELRAGALEDLWELRVTGGRHPEAVAELEHLVALHPLRERLWSLLARALYGAHRQGDALAALRRARDHLADELGIDPGPELRRVEDLVLRQDPELDAPAAAATPVRDPSAPAAPAPVGAPAPPDPGPDTDRLVGRDRVLDDLTAVLHDAVQGRGRLVLVSGEPGIGKTSLLQALARRAAGLGMRCGSGSWETEAVPALWGWTRAVDEALGGAEALAAPSGDGVDAASASFRQADALVSALGEGPATLLLLDDVHWADADSLRLLLRVAARVRSAPVVVVAGLRSSEADHGPAMLSTLAGLARLDPVRVELGGLDADAITDWVGSRAGVEVGAEVAAALADRSGGNPLYVGELVRLLVRHGALGSLDAPAWRTVPDNVRDLVRHRTAELAPASAHVLRTAAVAGRAFDLLVVERASGADAETVDTAVESALVLGLVEAVDVGRYRFTHALVRDALYAMVPPPTRARTHASVATALEDRYAGTVGAHVSELAEHYRLAGPALSRSAWLFANRAAEAAAAQSAWDEALRLHELAATLQESDPAVTAVERESVLLGRVAALVRLGHPLQAWPLVSDAATSALARGDVEAAALALLSITVASVWGWRQTSEYDLDAIALWDRVLDLLPA
ncbi:MAG TPA: BTAD domain-containing putative transcriptional regulator, partial [Ornithinibacter sp.]|nr:BTAD domain-containing putative transcriptional regulator [Ornithinibacter sp.]